MDDNDVVLGDDTVSRYHCRIIQDDTGYILVDNASTNGTFVNKVRVREALPQAGLHRSASARASSGSTRAKKRSRSSRRAPIAAAA